jgi:broad specificity phosphatase PhoE
MKRTWLLVGLVLGIALPAVAQDLYFLRHAQTMANVTRDYSAENQRVFSPLGLQQRDGVVDKLADYTFDHIIVSPAWRTIHTILPYLETTGRTAEIWPELYECCWDQETEEAEPRVTRGEPIELSDDWAAHFRFRDEESTHMLEVDTPARGDLMVADAVERIRQRFESGESVLIISHYHTSGRIMQSLLGPAAPRTLRPGNTRLNHLTPDEQGHFRLVILNDRPVE